VLRIIRKIVRGLSHYHGVETAVPDDRVLADVLRHAVPPGVLDGVVFEHREEDICRYTYQVDPAGIRAQCG
jgi:hypothetical protein